MIDTALDTVCLQHLLRPSSRVQRRRDGFTSLDEYIRAKNLQIAIDADRGLVSEWAKTCGSEAVGVLVTRWAELGGVYVVKPLPKLPRDMSKQLARMGFSDTGDRLILRIALGTRSKIVTSNDSDFWDPRNRASRGKPAAPVAKLCRDRCNVRVMLLAELLAELAGLT